MRPSRLACVERRFWDHIREGMSPGEAGVAVGVSVQTGKRWFAEAGGVRPKFPDESAPRKRPRLTLDERMRSRMVWPEGRVFGRWRAGWVGRHRRSCVKSSEMHCVVADIGPGIGKGRSGVAAGILSRGIGPAWLRTAPTTGRAGPSRASWPPMSGCTMRCRLG
jgi:hypothetical protein